MQTDRQTQLDSFTLLSRYYSISWASTGLDWKPQSIQSSPKPRPVKMSLGKKRKEKKAKVCLWVAHWLNDSVTLYESQQTQSKMCSINISNKQTNTAELCDRIQPLTLSTSSIFSFLLILIAFNLFNCLFFSLPFIHACSSSPLLHLFGILERSPEKSYLCNLFLSISKRLLLQGVSCLSRASLTKVTEFKTGRRGMTLQYPQWVCVPGRWNQSKEETMEGERVELPPAAGLSRDWCQLEICPDKQQMKKSEQLASC